MNYFTFPIRIYYADTDAGNVVYHANYLKYMDIARTEWLMKIGINLSTWANENDEIFVVTKANLDYHKPAKLLDELSVVSQILTYSKVRMTFLQKIMRNDEVLVTGQIEIVCLNSKRLRPVRFPKPLVEWHSRL